MELHNWLSKIDMMRFEFKKRLMKKWWFRSIRSYTWFSFRYYWLNYLIWGILTALLIWLLLTIFKDPGMCNEDKEINRLLRKIDRELESCCNCNIVETEIDSLSRDNRLDSLRDSLDACDGEITVTLAWKTSDDLDLHLVEPDGNVVFYKRPTSPNGAKLDIDMNADGGSSNTPIENICYLRVPPGGTYKVLVHFFSRNSSDPEIPYTVYVRNGRTEKYFTAVHTTVKDKHLIYEFTYPE
jgi:hypothetical protein